MMINMIINHGFYTHVNTNLPVVLELWMVDAKDVFEILWMDHWVFSTPNPTQQVV